MILNKIKSIIGRKISLIGLSQSNQTKFSKESFSQTGEDVIVDFIFQHILKVEKFTYFDIGAYHSEYLSNTALFYKRGYKGITVDADPILCEQLKKDRPNELNLNYGIGININDLEIMEQEFYVMNVKTLNTFSKDEALRLHESSDYKIVSTIKIPVVHIHRLFKEYFLPDFLSIDIEGIDVELIKSINFDLYRPKVICVETAEFDPIPPGKKTYEAIDILKANNYMLYADTFNNSIFIDNNLLKEH